MIAINKKKKMLNMESGFVAERYSMLGTGRERETRTTGTGISCVC